VQRWVDAGKNGDVAIDAVPDAEAVLASDGGATPLTGMMFARPVDGAVAVLLATETIARRTSRAPVIVTGMGSAMNGHAFATREQGKLAGCEAAAAMALRAAGWGDVKPDIAEVSGSSVVGELMAIEALGLAKVGQGLQATNDGKVAINRSGGALPADPIMATGLIRLAQAAKQMSAPDLFDGPDPRRGIAHGAGGIAMQNNCVFTLEV
jgi:acetyl-CoA C-acetyltransferase